MTVLSGSTWKGAKLRIGEAKPDFKERYVILPTTAVAYHTYHTSTTELHANRKMPTLNHLERYNAAPEAKKQRTCRSSHLKMPFTAKAGRLLHLVG